MAATMPNPKLTKINRSLPPKPSLGCHKPSLDSGIPKPLLQTGSPLVTWVERQAPGASHSIPFSESSL